MYINARELGPDGFGAICALGAVVIPAVRWRLFRQLLADPTPAGRHKLWRLSFLLLFSPAMALMAAAQFLGSSTLVLAALPIVAVAWFGYLALLVVGVFRGEDLVE